MTPDDPTDRSDAAHHHADTADVDARLRAAERALGDLDADPADPSGPSGPSVPSPDPPAHDDLDTRLTAVERRLDDLDAAIQSVRGHVGAVDAVNESVERRANAALAAAERSPATHPLPDLPESEPADDDADGSGLVGRFLGR